MSTNSEFGKEVSDGLKNVRDESVNASEALIQAAKSMIQAGDASETSGPKIKQLSKDFAYVQKALAGLSPLAKQRLEKNLGGELDKKTLPNLAKLREELTKIKNASRSQANKDIFGKDIESLNKFESSLNKTTKKNKSNLDAQGKAVDTLKTKVNELVDTLDKLSGKVGKKNVLKISIENSGFQKILDDMNRAMTNFYKRNGKDDNFFDPKVVRENLNQEKHDISESIKNIGEVIGEGFDSSNLKQTITSKIAEIITSGVSEGVKNGSKLSGAAIAALLADQKEASEWGALGSELKRAKLSPKTIEGIMSNAMKYRGMDSADILAEERAKINAEKQKVALDAKQAMAKIRNSQETKRYQIDADVRDKQNERLTANEKLMSAISPFGDIRRKLAETLVEREQIENFNTQSKGNWDNIIQQKQAELVKLKTEFQNLRNDREKAEAENARAWSSRKEAVLADARATDIAMEKQMLDLQGRELTGMDEALMKMTRLLATRKEIEDKMEDGVRMTAAQVKNWQDLEKQVRIIAKEQFKIEQGYDDQNKALEKALKLTQSYDQKLQAIGNMLSGMVRLWDKVGSGVQSIFGRVRNNIVNMFSQGRSEVRNLVTEATEQYSKLERAQIGFSNFFGADSAKKLISQIQKEAIAAPSLSSGDLADYVAQLAPVSGGNADLALNATMGVLKAIQYSGSSASTEMWRVVTNIRDVMSKGMATTVDIRQFNKAMPAIEKALSDIGASEFLSNGQLKITKENAKQIVEMFARLNTDDSSPVKNIFKQMGNTMEALQEAFKERKTQAMMNVLQNSGAFDLAKGVLTDASNNGIITKVEVFLTEKLKNIVDYLKSVDWDRVGDALKSGFGKIADGVKTAYNTIKDSLPDTDGWSVVDTIFQSIRNIIVGFGDGVKTVITFFKNITSGLSPEIVEKAASAVGFLLSPAQKLFSYIGTLATTVTNISQNLNKTMSKFTQTRIENYNKYIDKASETMANAMTSQKNIMEYFKQFDNMVYDPKTGTYTGYKKVQVEDPNYERGYRWETKVTPNQVLTPNGFVDASAYKDMSLKQRAETYYGGSRVKAFNAGVANWGNRVMNTFVSQMNKLVMGGQLLAFGSGLQAMTEKTNTFGQVAAEAMKAIGMAMSGFGIGSTIGSMFGAVGGKIGGVIGGIATSALGIYNIIKAWYDAEKQKKLDEARAKLTDAENDYVDNLRRSIMNALGLDETKTESAKYVFNALTEMLNNEQLADIIGQGKYGDVEGVLEHFSVEAQAMLNRYHRSDMLEAIDDMMGNDSQEMSEEAKLFHSLTGKNYSNWGDKAGEEEKAIMAWLVPMIREHKLLSSSQVGGNLDEATDETIMNAFLEDMNGTINEGQVKYLKDKLAEANKNFPSDMDKVAEQLKNNSTAQGTLKSSIDTLTEKVKHIIEHGVNVSYYGDTTNDPDSSKSDEQKAVDNAKNGSNMGWLDNNTNAYNKAMENGVFDNGTVGVVAPDRFKNGDQYYDRWLNELQPLMSPDVFQNRFLFVADAFEGLYGLLKSKVEKYTKDGNMDMLGKIQKMYEKIASESFVGLSADESRDKFIQLIKDLHAIAPEVFRAAGGVIPMMQTIGRGVDTVPAMLQPGEFVMRRGSVMKAGLGVMEALNRGDLAAAARGLGARFITGANNSRNWSSTINNNQRTNNNVFNIVNRNMSSRASTYNNIANRIATI